MFKIKWSDYKQHAVEHAELGVMELWLPSTLIIIFAFKNLFFIFNHLAPLPSNRSSSWLPIGQNIVSQ